MNLESVPTVHAEDVISLMSDSGVTRYRLKASIWDIYSKEGQTNWIFPRGIYVEKFDSIFQVEASVVADTAYYFGHTGIWQLIGNVKVINLKQETFETSELFWDQKTAQVYSDSLVRVEQQGAVIVSIGFKSNQEMNNYMFYSIQPSTYFEVKGDTLPRPQEEELKQK
ncbi:LPS export ABC transporter periplasmic protein LptC [Bacteroidales bacterium]|nr:LPS export ABC transporter periplasmic protein LptC [Bacteroidales bacterium]